jgi:hypothetical protein
MVNWGISEFLGCMFILPMFAYLNFVIFEGIGILKDQFKTSNKLPR